MGEILQKKYRFTEACIRLEKGKGIYSDSKISTAEEAVRLLQGELSGYDREVVCGQPEYEASAGKLPCGECG